MPDRLPLRPPPEGLALRNHPWHAAHLRVSPPEVGACDGEPRPGNLSKVLRGTHGPGAPRSTRKRQSTWPVMCRSHSPPG